MSDELEQEFILQLAGIHHADTHPGDGHHGPRRVATAAGAQFYGQPIGTIITKDLLDKIHAEKGPGPKGALAKVKAGGNSNLGTPHAANPNDHNPNGSGGAQPGSGVGGTAGAAAGGGQGAGAGASKYPQGGNSYTQKGYAAPGIDSTPPDWMSGDNPHQGEVPQMAKGIGKSTLSGPNKFDVGDAHYTAPEGSKLIRPKNGSDFAVVMTPDGEPHFFTSKGEVEADNLAKSVFKTKFASGKVDPNDPNYAEDQFTPGGLEGMQPGQHLYDKEGNKVFTKTEGGFEHSDLGFPVSEEDIKPLHDSGELTTKGNDKAPEDVTDQDLEDEDNNEISFDDMSLDEFKNYISTLDKDEKLYFVHKGDEKKGTPSEYSTLTHVGGSIFEREDPDGKTYTTTPSALYHVRSGLRTIEPTDLQPHGTAQKKAKDDEVAKLKDASDKADIAASKAHEQASKTANPFSDGPSAAQKNATKKAQEASDAKKAYEDAAGITQANADAEAAEKSAAKEAKKAADRAELESEAKQAVKETSDIQDHLATLSDDEAENLKSLAIGEHPSSTFLSKAMNGSQILKVSQGGDHFVYTKKGNHWTYKGQEYSPGQLANQHGNIVAHNPLNSETKWFFAKNAGSADKVGDSPTSEFIFQAPVGSQMKYVTESGTNADMFMNAEGNWIYAATPNSTHAGLQANLPVDAALGKVKITHIGDGDKSVLHVGDKISSPEDYDKLYLQANPGTQVKLMPQDKMASAHATITLDEDGVWHGDKPYIDDSYDLNKHGLSGDFYVTKLGEGEPSMKPLGPGDEPDIAWMEHAPVGTTLHAVGEGGWESELTKQDSGLWKYPTQSEGFGFSPQELHESDGPYMTIQDKPSGDAVSPGVVKAGTVATYDDILKSPVGTVFHYHKLNGSTSIYSKLNDTEVLMPEGVIQPLHHWQKSVDSGKVSFAKDTTLLDAPTIPVEPPDPHVPEPEPLQKGEDAAEKFDEYKEGLADWEKALLEASLSSPKLSEYNQKMVNSLVAKHHLSGSWEKLEEGNEGILDDPQIFKNGSLVHNGSDIFAAEHTPGGLSFYIPDEEEAGWFSGDQIVSDATGPVHFMTPTSQAQVPGNGVDDLDSILDDWDISGVVPTKEETYEAIAALENHSHGSPVYGLKSLPDDHPLKKSSAELIDTATKTYPGLGKKQAVIKFLKSKVEPSDIQDINEQDDHLVHLGADKPAKNAFGVTGGDFKQSEIEDAINILENFDGKAFKAALVNKNNKLGQLDFHSVVGKEKDKLVQKQKVIDHLKSKINNLPETKTPDPVDPAHQFSSEHGYSVGDVVYDTDQLDALPLGSVIQDEGEELWTKTGKWVWKNEDGDSVNSDLLAVDDNGFSGNKVVSVGSDESSLQKLAKDDIDDLPLGSKLVYQGYAGQYTLTKVPGSGAFTNGYFEADNGAGFDSDDVKDMAEKGKLSLLSVPDAVNFDDGTEITSLQAFHDLPIGSVVRHDNDKNFVYTKIGDNTWEVQNLSGVTVSGYSTGNTLGNDDFSSSIQIGGLRLLSQPSELPSQYVAPAALQSKVTPDEVTGKLPGLYIHKNGESKVHIFADGTGVSNIGGYSGKDSWLPKEAVDVLDLSDYTHENPTLANAKPDKPKPAPKPVKSPTVAFNPKDIPNGTYYLGDPDDSSSPVWTVKDGVASDTSYGSSPISNTKLKNAVLKGNLLDKWGNTAVLPEGHTGSVKFLGHETNVENLNNLYSAINSDEPQFDGLTSSPSDMHMLALYGVYTHAGNLVKYSDATQGGHTSSDLKESIKGAIESIVGDVPEHKPDLDNPAAGEFDWLAGQDGKALYPAYIAQHFPNSSAYWMSSGDAKKAIEDISAHFGDGKTIGQHITGLNAAGKRQWLKAAMDGDFKKMYELEVQGAIKHGTSHPAGWKHPGFPDNKSTHKIGWGPVIAGEKTPGDNIPGNWSEPTQIHNADVAEINNFLIAAQMQNPTFLSEAERRQWVKMFRNGDKQGVDAMSAKALARKNDGFAPLSSEPVWDDNVKPPKLYNSFFTADDPYPVSPWLSYASDAAANQFYADYENGDVSVKDYHGKDVPFSKLEQKLIETGHTKQAVNAFFADVKSEFEGEKAKPVYSMAPTQNLKQSKHPIYKVTDQFGNEYVFKPGANDQNGSTYRAKVEAYANKISRFFGGRAPDTEVVEFNGKIGSMQKYVDSVKSLQGFNWANADTKQIEDLAHEHMIDWMLDQDDNWAPNTLLTADGHLVGIDKGRSFLNYGSWKGMRSDAGMDVNTHLVYSDMYKAIMDGSISKEDADKAWLATLRRATKMSKADDGHLLELLHAATDDRKDWQVSYSIDGKKLPNTQQGFFDAFMDRKAKLPEQVRAMWADMYKKAGYGDLPEPQVSSLGEGQHSGLDDSALHETAFKVGSVGTSTLLGSHHVIGGTATVWGTKNSDGSKDINAQMYLSPSKQDEALAWFKANADPNTLSADKADPNDFSYDDHAIPFVSAAKTIGSHAEDQQYNSTTLKAFHDDWNNIKKDLDYWNPDMVPDANKDFIEFPSGHKVKFQQVDQYKMMLDHYNAQAEMLEQALANHEKPPETVTPFAPLELPDANVIYLDGNGQKMVKLADGKWIYTNSNILSIISNDEATKLYEDPDMSWTKWADTPEAPKIAYQAALGPTHEKSGNFADFELSTSGSHLSGGNPGNEYKVTLPTGETIHFRDSNATNTKRGQQGRITVRVPKAKNESDIANGMSNAQSWLEDNLGLNLDAADHDNAELLYWREMYGILANRNHKTGSPYAKAKADLDKKISEMGANEKNFLDKFGDSASVDEQNQFFRDLWSKHFGAEKVNAMIASEGYLPHYENFDLRHPDAITGKPNWTRFDVSLEDLEKNNAMLVSRAASASHGLDVVKSGGAFSTEERLRLFGQWITGMSSGADQGYGSSNFVFTRIMPTTQHSGFSFVYHPRAMLRTRTYSFNGDHFGRLDDRKASAPSNPLDSWVNFKGVGGNETMIPNGTGLMGDLEIVVFDDATLLNNAIQELKKRGITEIRGVPIEDRLVIRAKLQQAIDKLKNTWYKTHE